MTGAKMDTPLLKVCGLKKSFGGVEVLHSIDFIAEAGKVTALVGENGAGKSTFMKILMGEYDSDAGTIELNGKEVHFTDSHQALSNGISNSFINDEITRLPIRPIPKGISSAESTISFQSFDKQKISSIN